MIERKQLETEFSIHFETEELKQLGSYKKVEFIKHGENNLQALISKISEPLGKKPLLIHLMGAPGSGKSYMRRLIESHFKKITLSDQSLTIHTISWDKIEAELIKRKNQDPPIFKPDDPYQPFKDNELKIVNAYFNNLLTYSMGEKNLNTAFVNIQKLLSENPSFKPQPGENRENFERRILNILKRLIRQSNLNGVSSNSILIVEQPGATALKHPQLGWQQPYRDYTTRTLDDILHQRDIFSAIDREKWYIAAIGAVGGPSMEIFDYYRDDLKQVRSIEGANHLNQHYGLPPFSKKSEWFAARTGATRIQMYNARIAMWEALKTLTQSRKQYRIAYDSPLPFYLQQGILHTPLLIKNHIDIFHATLPGDYEKKQFASIRYNAEQLVKKYRPFNVDESVWIWTMMYNLALATVLENNIAGLSEKNMRKRPDALAIVLSNPPYPKNDKI